MEDERIAGARVERGESRQEFESDRFAGQRTGESYHGDEVRNGPPMVPAPVNHNVNDRAVRRQARKQKDENPRLLDNLTFPDVKPLSGDVGKRAGALWSARIGLAKNELLSAIAELEELEATGAAFPSAKVATLTRLERHIKRAGQNVKELGEDAKSVKDNPAFFRSANPDSPRNTAHLGHGGGKIEVIQS